MDIRLRLKHFFTVPHFLVCLLLLFSAKGHLEIIDTEYSVRTALALVEDGSMLIDVVCDAALKLRPKLQVRIKYILSMALVLWQYFYPL